MKRDPFVTPELRRFSIHLTRPRWILGATVVLLVAIVGLRIGVPVYRQHAAVREIERLGINVGVEAAGPVWLRDWVGAEKMKLFGKVTLIQIGGWRGPDNEVLRVNATDEHVRLFQDFHDLKVLYLDGAQITDDSLRYLRQMSKLELLNLEGTDVTDASLVHLTGLTNLQVLFLSDTRVTDSGVAELKRALPDLAVCR